MTFEVGDLAVLAISGVETRVVAIDESDGTFMDECGGWHSYEDADTAFHAAVARSAECDRRALEALEEMEAGR